MGLPTIYGFNECSEAGVDIFAPTIFFGGCNLRCPYCMNSKLVSGYETKLEPIPIEKVKQYVKEEECEWVMISGGEPILQPHLNLLIATIKSWGCKVGLCTNGTKPEVLKEILWTLDYVAMDLKCRDYKAVKADGNVFAAVTISKSLIAREKINRSSFGYEIRTTLFPSLVKKEDIKYLGGIMRRDEKWVLQQFRATQNALDPKVAKKKPYTDKQLEVILKTALKITPQACLKYV